MIEFINLLKQLKRVMSAEKLIANSIECEQTLLSVMGQPAGINVIKEYNDLTKSLQIPRKGTLDEVLKE